MARLGVLLTALLLSSASPALCLKGKVVRQDGTPVADATVSILGRPGATRTDSEGSFTWQPDPPVPFEVLVLMPGDQYMAPVRIEEIPATAPLLITVKPLAMEEVTVTADAAPHIQAPPASGMNLLAREDLQQRAPARLADAVENIPGVSRLGHGHDAVPSIRGLARGRTLVLIDGARVTTERRAGPSAGFLDPFFLEALEVSRGPGSVAYGSDALGGVIHARTRQARPGAPAGFRFQGSLGAGVPEASAGFELSRGLPEGGWIFQTRAREFGDYESPSGEIRNSSATDYGFLGRLDHEAGAGRLSLTWQSDLARDTERPLVDSHVVEVSQPREDSHRLTYSYQMDPLSNATLIGFNGFLGSYRLVTQQDRKPTSTAPRAIFLSDIRARDYGLRALAIRPLRRARVEAGLDLNGRFDLEARGTSPAGEERPISKAGRTDAGLYVLGEASPRPAMMVTGGLRLDRVSARVHGGTSGDLSRTNRAVSGFTSLTAGPFRGLSLTGQVARGFRDPTLSDRFFRGISGRGFVEGNPDLDPETSLQFDIALRYSSQRLRCAVYAYDYRIQDLIERFQDPNMAQDPNTGQDLFFFRNRGEAHLRGGELELHADLAAGFTLELGAQTARGEADDGSPLADIPPESVTLQLRKKMGERGWTHARAALYERDEDPGPTELPTPSYATLDVGGGWSLSQHVELRVLVRNLFDRRYPASVDEKAVTAPGRSGLLTLVASLGG